MGEIPTQSVWILWPGTQIVSSGTQLIVIWLSSMYSIGKFYQGRARKAVSTHLLRLFLLCLTYRCLLWLDRIEWRNRARLSNITRPEACCWSFPAGSLYISSYRSCVAFGSASASTHHLAESLVGSSHRGSLLQKGWELKLIHFWWLKFKKSKLWPLLRLVNGSTLDLRLLPGKKSTLPSFQHEQQVVCQTNQ